MVEGVRGALEHVLAQDRVDQEVRSLGQDDPGHPGREHGEHGGQSERHLPGEELAHLALPAQVQGGRDQREQEPERPLDQGGDPGQQKGVERPASLALARKGAEQAGVAEDDERREHQVHARVVEQPGQEEVGKQDEGRGQGHGAVELQGAGQGVGRVHEEQAGQGRAHEEYGRRVRRGELVEEPQEPEVDRGLVRVGLAIEGQDHPLAVLGQVFVGIRVPDLVREPQGAVIQAEPGLGEHGQGHGHPGMGGQPVPETFRGGAHFALLMNRVDPAITWAAKPPKLPSSQPKNTSLGWCQLR